MNDAEKLARADKARAVIENPIYQEAWENTRKAIWALIEQTPLADDRTAHELRLCLKLLRDVQGNLNEIMSAGKMASFKLAREAERKKETRTGIIRNFFR